MRDIITPSEERVAPYVGAWIETIYLYRLDNLCTVAPYVGAWIETHIINSLTSDNHVAPYVGAWIETVT